MLYELVQAWFSHRGAQINQGCHKQIFMLRGLKHILMGLSVSVYLSLQLCFFTNQRTQLCYHFKLACLFINVAGSWTCAQTSTHAVSIVQQANHPPSPSLATHHHKQIASLWPTPISLYPMIYTDSAYTHQVPLVFKLGINRLDVDVSLSPAFGNLLLRPCHLQTTDIYIHMTLA